MNNIYQEICDNLRKHNIKSKIISIRNFECINIQNISVFISEDILYIVKGNKIPPVIDRKSINEPGFDITNHIMKILNIPTKPL